MGEKNISKEDIKPEYRGMSARDVIKKTRKKATESIKEEFEDYKTF